MQEKYCIAFLIVFSVRRYCTSVQFNVYTETQLRFVYHISRQSSENVFQIEQLFPNTPYILKHMPCVTGGFSCQFLIKRFSFFSVS